MNCLSGGLRAKTCSGGQRAPRSRQAPALRPVSAHLAAAQEWSSAHCTAKIPGLRRARREAGTQGVKRGRPGRAAGRRRARELRLQTAPAGLGVRAPAQPQLIPRPQPRSAPALAPRSGLPAPRCALPGTESSAHPQVSSGHGSLASPELQRGDRRLRGDDKLSSSRGRVWGHPWGCRSSGGPWITLRCPASFQSGEKGRVVPVSGAGLGVVPALGNQAAARDTQCGLCEAYFADGPLWVPRDLWWERATCPRPNASRPKCPSRRPSGPFQAPSRGTPHSLRGRGSVPLGRERKL